MLLGKQKKEYISSRIESVVGRVKHCQGEQEKEEWTCTLDMAARTPLVPWARGRCPPAPTALQVLAVCIHCSNQVCLLTDLITAISSFLWSLPHPGFCAERQAVYIDLAQQSDAPFLDTGTHGSAPVGWLPGLPSFCFIWSLCAAPGSLLMKRDAMSCSFPDLVWV